MPRNVRNFWIELDVDGKKTPIATGPVKKDGVFYLTVSMRNEDGTIHKNAISLEGFVMNEPTGTKRELSIGFYIDGCLVTSIDNGNPMTVKQH